MTRWLDVNKLANEIRRVDGNHDLGAGALAEALMEFLDIAHGIAQDEAFEEAYNFGAKRVRDSIRDFLNEGDPESPEPCDTCYLIGPTAEYGIEEIGYFSDLGSAAEARANHVDNADWKIWVALYNTEHGYVIEGTAKPVVF